MLAEALFALVVAMLAATADPETGPGHCLDGAHERDQADGAAR